MKEKLKIFESKKKIFSSVSYSRALIGQDSDSCETLRSRQIYAPSLHPTYFLILSAPTIYNFSGKNELGCSSAEEVARSVISWLMWEVLILYARFRFRLRKYNSEMDN